MSDLKLRVPVQIEMMERLRSHDVTARQIRALDALWRKGICCKGTHYHFPVPKTFWSLKAS